MYLLSKHINDIRYLQNFLFENTFLTSFLG